MPREVSKESLLKFLYQTPLGLAKFDESGSIDLLNAHGVAILYQFFPEKDHSNIFRIFEDQLPDLCEKLSDDKRQSGTIINHVLEFSLNCQNYYVSVRINRLEPEVYMLVYDDISEHRRSEIALNEKKLEASVQTGKLQIASGILHDIGNAISGANAMVTQNLGKTDWQELKSLDRLIQLFGNHKISLNGALGEDKTAALIEFSRELAKQFASRRTDWLKFATYMSTNIEHIQQILTIQRNYVGNFRNASFSKINLTHLIQDALRMNQPLLKSREVEVSYSQDEEGRFQICGDPTKLMQVFINLIKNAVESMEKSPVKILEVVTQIRGEHIEITIGDSGSGLPEKFDPFALGNTTKTEGSGLGLAFIKDIVSAHHGNIMIKNRENNEGVLVNIEFPSEDFKNNR